MYLVYMYAYVLKHHRSGSFVVYVHVHICVCVWASWNICNGIGSTESYLLSYYVIVCINSVCMCCIVSYSVCSSLFYLLTTK